MEPDLLASGAVDHSPALLVPAVMSPVFDVANAIRGADGSNNVGEVRPRPGCSRFKHVLDLGRRQDPLGPSENLLGIGRLDSSV